MNLIEELLRAGAIVGLDPREMTRHALEELARDAEFGPIEYELGGEA